MKLSHESGSPFALYSQDEDYVLPLLAETCLTYLMFEEFSLDIVEDWDNWKQQQIRHPFRCHAVSKWPVYVLKNTYGLESRDMLRIKPVQECILQLFDPSKTASFLSWARDYTFVEFVSRKYDEIFEEDENVNVNFIAVTKAICMGGVTPLHMAALMGFYELSSRLCEGNSLVNQMSTLGTPIQCAILGGNQLCSMLNAQGGNGRLLPTYSNLMVDGRVKFVDLLIEVGANIHIPFKDITGRTYSTSILALSASISNHTFGDLMNESNTPSYYSLKQA